MTHRHKKNHPGHISKSREWLKERQSSPPSPSKQKLEIVLKCDSAGSLEAVTEAILKSWQSPVDISIIHKEIGDVHESDLLIAETGSKLIIGFQVGLTPLLKHEAEKSGIDIRLYDVIYKLTDDIKGIAEDMLPHVPEENILGTAKIIALFKSGRKDIIVGCKILNGIFALHNHYRIISAMGPVYAGIIDSMHIENHAVQKATKNQEVGIKIRNYKKVRIGDLLETFR